MDILDSYSPASSKQKYLFIAIDYFIKWEEAKFLTHIMRAKLIYSSGNHSFANLSFSTPSLLIIAQFDKEFCAELHIRHWFTSVGHSQMNKKVELMNHTILLALKTRLDEAKGRWIEELPLAYYGHITLLQDFNK